MLTTVIIFFGNNNPADSYDSYSAFDTIQIKHRSSIK